MDKFDLNEFVARIEELCDSSHPNVSNLYMAYGEVKTIRSLLKSTESLTAYRKKIAAVFDSFNISNPLKSKSLDELLTMMDNELANIESAECTFELLASELDRCEKILADRINVLSAPK